jgi:NAD(P)-dependent dehydrogenase (short-subunit alcohol dehydrogenase family)
MLRGVADRLAAETGKTSDALFAGMVPAQLGRHIQPIEVGCVVVFLLTEAAEIIRGQAINIDGGETPY